MERWLQPNANQFLHFRCSGLRLMMWIAVRMDALMQFLHYISGFWIRHGLMSVGPCSAGEAGADSLVRL